MWIIDISALHIQTILNKSIIKYLNYIFHLSFELILSSKPPAIWW